MARDRIGPYRILEDLGQGGMGTVHLAEVEGQAPGLEPGTRVALKLIHPHLLGAPGFLERFRREAEIGRSVDHPNVVRCLDCVALPAEGRQQHVLVMEYVEGRTLRTLLDDLGVVPEELCRHVGREVARGLQAIHEAGVVHRDLKPENVLITSDHSVKIMDLGVARLQDEVIRLSQTGAFAGSVAYAAPEQFGRGARSLDGRSDLHALGVMLYELSTGHHPHRADDVQSTLHNVMTREARRVGDVNPQLSPFFEEVVHTLLAKERGKRFPSAERLQQVLEEGESSPWWQERAHRLHEETRRPLRRIRMPRETALHGRDQEIVRLRAAYEQAKAGRGQVVLVGGEAGIGKTRLVDEFVGRLEREGEKLNFLWGCYPSGGAATAEGAFSTAYREHFGVQRLEEALPAYLPQTTALVPAFAALLRGEPPPPGQVPLTKESMQTVFVHVTRALASERPTVILVDDLHFAPEEGRALFASLALAVSAEPVLLVGTLRPGVPEAWVADVEREEHAVRLELPRLGAKDLSELLEETFRSRRLADSLGMKIARKSDGNPFFVFEIVRGLRSGSLIAERPDGSWVATQVIEDVEVPSSVADLVQARISPLGEGDKNLLDVAACVGFRFDPFVVAEALRIDPVAVMQRLAWLERRHQLVRSAGPVFLFDHHQVQEVLEAGLPEPLREAYHGRIAAALEDRRARGAEAGDASIVDLCEHALAGRDFVRARRHLSSAIDHLGKGYLHGRAARLAKRALDLEGLLEDRPRCELLLDRIRLLYVLGRRDEEERAVEEASSLARRLGDDELLVGAARARASLQSHLGRGEEARASLDEALQRTIRIGDRAMEAKVTLHLAAMHLRARRHREARQACERALVLAREVDDRKTVAIVAGYLGVIAMDLGEFAEAHARFAERLERAREAEDRIGEGVAVANIGWAYHCQGRHVEATAWHRRGLAIAREIGFREMEAAALANLGSSAEALGRFEEAREHYDAYARIAREIGDTSGVASAWGHLGSLALRTGRLEAARSHLTRRLEAVRGLHDLRDTASALGNLGQLQFWLGHPDAGRELLDEALALARQTENRRQQGWWQLGIGEIEERRGDLDRAAGHLEDGLRLLQDIGDRVGVVSALVARGRLHARRGAASLAVTDLDAALDASRELELPGLCVLAAAWRATLPGGHPDEARAEVRALEAGVDLLVRLEARAVLWGLDGETEDLEAARELARKLLAHAPEDDRETMCARVPLLRSVLRPSETEA